MAISERPVILRRDLVRIFSEDRLVAVIRTPTVDAAELAALATDAEFARQGAIVGAGTVLSGAQAEDALIAGARFLVSPALIPEMIAAAKSRDAMTMPGTMTPTEMVKAAELGADFIKVYPLATIGGPAFITNVRRALHHLPLVATGNVELAEIPAYFKAGVVGFGIGGPLIRPDLLDKRDVDGVVANAKRFLAA